MKSGVANVKSAVEAKQGDIFTREYMETLSKINDEVFFVKGVDRSAMQAIWTPNTRWTDVTEEGLQSGQVVPSSYDGSPESMQPVRQKNLKPCQVSCLVANNFS